MQRVNRLILPIGLPILVAVGLFVPSIGASVGGLRIGPLSFSDLCVITIFFVNGLQIRLAGARDAALLRAVAIVLAINLVLGPLVGAAAVWTLSIPLGLAVGIALMTAVPTTLSSAAVIAITVGGDRLWALTLTIVTVLVGSLTAPLAASAILSADVTIDPWPVLADVVGIVVVPTIAGYLLRKLTWHHPPQWLGVVPSVAVLAVVWVTMSSNAAAARQLDLLLLVAMVVAAAAWHGLLLLASGVASRGMPVSQAMPVLFVASQKTLPLALTILTIIEEQVPSIQAVAAVATIACLVWHFLQLFVDSTLSNRLALRHAAV